MTHLGCSVPWEQPERQFICPCHASAFDAKGDVLNPPAPRALDLFPVIIEAGLVKVDTGTVLQRDKFDPSQVVLCLSGASQNLERHWGAWGVSPRNHPSFVPI